MKQASLKALCLSLMNNEKASNCLDKYREKYNITEFQEIGGISRIHYTQFAYNQLNAKELLFF